MELGSVAELIAAAAAIVAAGVSIQALRLARNSNMTAEAARREAKESAEQALALETRTTERLEESERRLLAGSLQAWWVADISLTKPVWGLLVSNTGPAATVFHEVTIKVTDSTNNQPLSIETVPPGRIFVESKYGGGWELPKAIRRMSNYEPITRSRTHNVSQIRFRDPLGTKWDWTPQGGLIRVSP